MWNIKFHRPTLWLHLLLESGDRWTTPGPTPHALETTRWTTSCTSTTLRTQWITTGAWTATVSSSSPLLAGAMTVKIRTSEGVFGAHRGQPILSNAQSSSRWLSVPFNFPSFTFMPPFRPTCDEWTPTLTSIKWVLHCWSWKLQDVEPHVHQVQSSSVSWSSHPSADCPWPIFTGMKIWTFVITVKKR